MSEMRNVKPKEWYEEYYRTISEVSEDEIEEHILDAMERDKEIDEGLNKHTKPDVKNDLWCLRGHSDNIVNEIFGKDDIILQKEIIEFINDFIDKKEIKKYIKKRALEFPILSRSYQDFKKFINHLSKALERGYHVYWHLGFLLFLIDELKKDFKEFINKKMTFPQFVRNTIKNDEIARIAEGLCLGKTLIEIDAENIDLTYAIIDKEQKKLRKVNHKNNLGFLFEDYFALVKLGVPKEFLREIVAHSENVPDIIWNDDIYSIKFRIDRQHKTLTFYQSIDCKPEYEEAIKRKTIYQFVFLNPKWSQEIHIKEINPFEDSDKIVCKPNRIIVMNPKKP